MSKMVEITCSRCGKSLLVYPESYCDREKTCVKCLSPEAIKIALEESK